MSVTKVGIKYSKSQEVVRSIIHLDREFRDGQWQFKHPEVIAAIDEDAAWKHHLDSTKAGEVLTFIDHATYHGFTEHQHIHDHLGLKGQPGVTDRCAVVHRELGHVLHTGLYDPDIDTHPEGDIVAHATAKVGDKIR